MNVIEKFHNYKYRFEGNLKQELLGQFSSTVEQKMYHLEWKKKIWKKYEKIDLKFISKETNKIRGKK